METEGHPEAPSAEMPIDLIEARYREAIAKDMGLSAAQLSGGGTIVLPEEGRSGSNFVAGYQIGNMMCLRSDPALADALESLVDPTAAISFEDFRAWAMANDWEIVDGADMHVVAFTAMTERHRPEGATFASLDRDQTADRSLIGELMAACDPDDVDAAEIEMDDLDPVIVGLLDDSGRLGAYCSARPWDEDERFDDIGVITRGDLRGHGWGASVVSDFCQISFGMDRLPLYRCNWSRTASKATAIGLGFKHVQSLLAVTPGSTLP